MTRPSAHAPAKRVLDILASAVGLAALWPLLGFIAVAVKLDSDGPILFRQRRLGKSGSVFDILKFRTMIPAAEMRFADDGLSVHNSATDSRVTRVGQVLRRTSLDELPQLINVLLGDMSLVGPRPDLPEALQLYERDEVDKLRVRPGLTGVSQVSGRNELPVRDRWRLDAEYARHASVCTDLAILLRTLPRVLSGAGLYASSEGHDDAA